MSKVKYDLSNEWRKIKSELKGTEDELFQYMKTEDSLSTIIRDKRSQAILNHWLQAIYAWNNDTPDAQSLSFLLSRHVEFIFSLEQICSTATESVVDGLFYLEDHANKVPRSDLCSLINELKRQQRLSERDVFIPLKRLELALQCGEFEVELDGKPV